MLTCKGHLKKAVSPKLENITSLPNIQKQKQQIRNNGAGRNTFQISEQDKITEELNEMETGNLNLIEFKVMIKELGRRLNEKSEKLKGFKKRVRKYKGLPWWLRH